MKLSIYTIIIFLGTFQTFAQFEEIDQYALETPKSVTYDLDELTEYLTKNAKSDLEKVRAFYLWLTHNINYDVAEYRKINAKSEGEVIYSENFDLYDRKMIQNALNNRKAVCQGYSLIFQEMCNKVGINNFLITGFTKNTRGESSNLGDHAWNVAFVDGKWRLFDATWGAGNVVNNRYFEQKFSEIYFDADPETMILNHLPSDPMWQLLNNPIKYQTFTESSEIIKEKLGQNSSSYFAYNDSINKFLSYPKSLQPLITAENAYKFNKKNEADLGYAWNNYAVKLSNKSIALEAGNGSIQEILLLNEQAIYAQKKAVLYTNDKRLLEGLGIFYLNQAKFLQDKGYNEAQNNQFDLAIDTYNISLDYINEAKNIYGDNKSINEAKGSSHLNLGYVYSSIANKKINAKVNFDMAQFHYDKAKKYLIKANTVLAKYNLSVVEQNLRAIKQNRKIFGL